MQATGQLRHHGLQSRLGSSKRYFDQRIILTLPNLTHSPKQITPTGNSTVTVLPYSWSAAGVASLTGTLPVGASLKMP